MCICKRVHDYNIITRYIVILLDRIHHSDSVFFSRMNKNNGVNNSMYDKNSLHSLQLGETLWYLVEKLLLD
jgi:hypothetical protein